MFIKVTRNRDKKTALVNVNKVQAVTVHDNICLIWFGAEDFMEVTESIDELERLLKGVNDELV